MQAELDPSREHKARVDAMLDAYRARHSELEAWEDETNALSDAAAKRARQVVRETREPDTTKRDAARNEALVAFRMELREIAVQLVPDHEPTFSAKDVRFNHFPAGTGRKDLDYWPGYYSVTCTCGYAGERKDGLGEWSEWRDLHNGQVSRFLEGRYTDHLAEVILDELQIPTTGQGHYQRGGTLKNVLRGILGEPLGYEDPEETEESA